VNLKNDFAYIAVTQAGYVDGACFADSEDSPKWVVEMEDAGMTIQRLTRAEAKRALYSQLPQSTLEA